MHHYNTDFHEKVKKNPPGKKDYEPTLPVTNSTKDAENVAKFIDDNSTAIDEIHITLDTHHANHIGHASFWENKNPTKYKEWIEYDKENGTYKGWCVDFINDNKGIKEKQENKVKLTEEETKIATRLFNYGLLLFGEQTKDEKIKLLNDRINDVKVPSKEEREGEFLIIKDREKSVKSVTRGWWLDGIDEKVKGKSGEDEKNIYRIEIENIEKQRKEPEAFSTIDCEMVRREVWVPKDESLYDYAIYYTSKLDEKGRFTHTIWPPHCLVGTEGHEVEDKVMNACNRWTKHTLNPVQYVYKGMNLLTENFSAIEAEVPLESDPLTKKNEKFLQKLRDCSKLIVVGQARSHCVRYTVEHIAEDWDEHVWDKASTNRKENSKYDNPQIIIPTDGSSKVAPPDAPDAFKESTNNFINDIKIKKDEKGNVIAKRNIITDKTCDEITTEMFNKNKKGN